MVVDSFLFLFFSMIIIAMTLYLPQHITFLTNRAWFYYNGDEKLGAAVMGNAMGSSAILKEVVKETVVAAAEGGGREL